MKRLTTLAVSLLCLGGAAISQAAMLGVNGGAGVQAGANDAGALMVMDITTGFGTVIGTPIAGRSLTGVDFDDAGRLFASTGSTSEGSQSALLIEIDPSTGSLLNTVGTITVDDTEVKVTDIAIQPGTNQVFATVDGVDDIDQNSILSVDPETAEAVVVGWPGFGGSFLAIAFAPDGTLYGVRTNQASGLLVLDPADGSVISETPFATGELGVLGLGFNPEDGYLYAPECCNTVGNASGNEVYRINPSDATWTLLGTSGNSRRTHDVTFGDTAFRLVPVPLLGGWGTLLLVLFLVGVGLLVQRRRAAFQA